MRTKLLPLVVLCLAGCASDPLLTGRAQDWQGKLAADLKTAWGEPTKITRDSTGDEIWEYVQGGDFVAPKEDKTSFNVGVGSFGGGGGISTRKYDQRLSNYQNISRFRIHNGKIKAWYAARVVDGTVVWHDQ
jgi:hypothetical protein